MCYTSSHSVRWGQNSYSCPSTPPSPSGVPEQLQAVRVIIHADSFQLGYRPAPRLPGGGAFSLSGQKPVSLVGVHPIGGIGRPSSGPHVGLH